LYNSPENNKLALKVCIISLLINIFLSGFKLIAGIIGHSAAMVSDAVHSASDVFSTVIVMIGMYIARQEQDEGHQYGHERIESVAAVILAFILIATSLGIAWSSLQDIIQADYHAIAIPGLLPLIAAVISIMVKEWMFWYTRSAAKKVSSEAMMADAWHHRSDALSSVGSFVGIAGARLGFPLLDPLASILIGIFIFKAGWQIAKNAFRQMVDCSCDEKTIIAIRRVVLENKEVLTIDDLKTRTFSSRFYVDIEISLPGDMSLIKAHAVAEKVHDDIERCFPAAKHCMVHVNPASSGNGKAGDA